VIGFGRAGTLAAVVASLASTYLVPAPVTSAAEISAGDNQTPACPAGVEASNHARELRATVGLAEDAETVERSFSTAGFTCEEFGIPLSSTETAAFKAVMRAQAELSTLAEGFVEDPAFGGAYLDGAELVVGTTTGTLKGDVRPARGTLRITKTRYAESHLQALAKDIADRSRTNGDSLASLGINLVSVDPRSNRVEVGVSSGVAAAEDALASMYGAAVTVISRPGGEVEPLACTVQDCGTRGGVQINHNNPSVGCTSGFLVKARRAVGGTWKHYILTAGHCIERAGGPSNTNKWFNTVGTITWGANAQMDFWPSSCGFACTYIRNDQGLVNMGGVTPAKWNEYNVNGSPASITGAVRLSNQLVGQVVCRFGGATGFRCGAINRKPTSVGVGWKVYYPVEVSMQSAKGDSGSGFYRVWDYNGTYFRDAYGTLTGGYTSFSQSYTYYYAWDGIFYEKRVDEVCEGNWWIEVCTTATCAL
jgi:hypothetical protein